ncbi:MAG: sugar phosphate isomerase/epimerase family protein [Phycisphaerales bacterium]
MARHENERMTRRGVLGVLGAMGIGSVALGARLPAGTPTAPAPKPGGTKPMKPELFKISLAEWSLHKPLYANEITNLDFPREARAMGFDAIEYVNSFFKDKARDAKYLADLNTRCDTEGVFQHLIMVDGEGRLGAPDDAERTQAIENHVQWLEAAKALGCARIRVNASSEGEWDEQQKLAADGLRRLCEKAEPFGLDVIVENHGGPTSNGQWLAGLIKRIDHPLAGTLPDFGNFCYDWGKADDPAQWYDRYQGVKDLMPSAKAVSAKSYDFDDAGNETKIDYPRMMKVVVDAGYRGWVGVEYEGERIPPREGTRLTKVLLERIRGEMS